MLKYLIYFLLPAILSSVHGETDYCAMSSQHTMCKYKAKACRKGSVKYGLSATDKKAVLKAHNELRKKVATGKQSGQPQASNMKEMVWDNELAKIAQRWCDQCIFGHDEMRNSKRFYVGQNFHYSYATFGNQAANFTHATYAWYNEVKNPGFKSSNIKPFQLQSGTNHYTQIVWAESKYLGCGYTFFSEKVKNKLIVCNYGPGGNILSGTMYKKGAPATACTNRTKSRSYSGLCK